MVQVQVRYIEMNSNDEGQRVDNYLIRELKGVPKSYIYRIIRGGEVRVNKKRVKPESRLQAGDILRIPPVRMSDEKPVFVGSQLSAQLQNSILYEDDHLLVVNKPRGIAVHGGSGLSIGLIEGFRKLRSDLHYLELVHRLDKETSGCLVLAKKRSMLRSLQALFTERAIEKEYWAIWSHTWVGEPVVTVDVALEKNTLQSGERFVRIDAEGKASQTQFKLLENFKEACLVCALPKTGRTHQIRVHSAYVGHPILGDEKYGADASFAKVKNRLYLHARAIQFNLNGRHYRFEADLDHFFKDALAFFRNENSNAF